MPRRVAACDVTGDQDQSYWRCSWELVTAVTAAPRCAWAERELSSFINARAPSSHFKLLGIIDVSGNAFRRRHLLKQIFSARDDMELFTSIWEFYNIQSLNPRLQF